MDHEFLITLKVLLTTLAIMGCWVGMRYLFLKYEKDTDKNFIEYLLRKGEESIRKKGSRLKW